ncbi:MAG: acetylglutamate kinase [Methanomassiliicoccales archaeon]|nr:acetylglutamate kinase [Methanomassiliicoccales archaeon]
MAGVEIPKEMIPRLAKLRGKKIVIKFGGSTLNGNGDMASFCEDIALLVSLGVRPVIVHGGGPEINDEMKKLGKEIKKVAGLRVTDDETLEIVRNVLARINEEIVNALRNAGIKAIGIEGAEGRTVICTRMPPIKTKDENGHECFVDLGNVGEVSKVDPTLINLLCASGFVPVVYPICVDENGKRVNVNADTVAAYLAKALRSEDIFLVTDVPGLMKENGNGATVIPQVSLREIDALIASGVVKDGMVPKLEACRLAILSGVKTAHMVCGKIPHSILNELLGMKNSGTRITH